MTFIQYEMYMKPVLKENLLFFLEIYYVSQHKTSVLRNRRF